MTPWLYPAIYCNKEHVERDSIKSAGNSEIKFQFREFLQEYKLTLNISKIRLLFHKFRYTPFHPQWFAYHYEKSRYVKVGNLAKGNVLDIGCGRQTLRKYLHAATTYISLDFPETGQTLYNANPSIFGNAERLPFKDGSFDTIVLLEILEHLPNPAAAIHEAIRVLKKGGILVVSTPFLYPIHDAPHDFQRWTCHGLEKLFNLPGIVIRERHTMGTPIESGILLFNLSIAWTALNSPIAGRIPLIFLSLISIPLTNIFGFAISSLFKLKVASPFAIGYLLIVKESKQ